MIFAGIDIGSVTTKTVLLDTDANIINFTKIPTTFDRKKCGDECLAFALDKVGKSTENIKMMVATGYGRRSFAQAQLAVPEIICHGRGYRFSFS